jgi:hypothetical protein
MKTGDVKSAYFLLQTRFSDEGFGKSSKLNVTARSQNLNLNAAVPMTFDETEAIRARILDKLKPRELPPGFCDDSSVE